MAMFTEGELVPLARRLGFDATAAPPWVMVQAGSAKIVSLKDGSGLSLQLRSVWDPSSSGAATFQEYAGINTRRIVLTAKGAGTVFLEAVDATGRTQATLEITVKEKMTLHVFSHFVFEKSGRMGSTGPDEARQMVEVANKLYLPQANIELVLDGSGPCRLPFDMDRGLPIHLPPFNAPRRWLRNTPAGPLPCIASRTPDARGCLPEEVQGPLKTLEDFKALRKYQIICNIVGNIDQIGRA